MSNKDNNLNYLLNKGAVFSAVKYIVVFLGFFRTLITADILTKNELGLLAFVLLILEYMTIIAPMGSVYALNKDITNKQSRSNRISKKNSEVLIFLFRFFILYQIHLQLQLVLGFFSFYHLICTWS